MPIVRHGQPVDDEVAVEEPLEIRLGGQPLAVVMRTPGHDVELALGFLLTEGVLPRGDLAGLAAVTSPNVVDFPPPPSPAAGRRFAASAGCGVCGKETIESLTVRASKLDEGFRLAGARLGEMAAALALHQDAFRRTGGLHGAALATADGRLTAVREDIGRHNAVDKLIGRAVRLGELPLAESTLIVSGRVGFEVAQKAVVAGIPVLAGVSAPSSLAVEMANELGLTLVGFLRDGRYNVYAGGARLT